MSGGLFHPRPFSLRSLAIVSFRLSADVSSSLSLALSLEGLFRPCVSFLSISTVVDVSVETEDPTPPANHAATIPSFLGKAKRKQITAQSSHELQAPRRSFPFIQRKSKIFRSGLLHTVHLNSRNLH